MKYFSHRVTRLSYLGHNERASFRDDATRRVSDFSRDSSSRAIKRMASRRSKTRAEAGVPHASLPPIDMKRRGPDFHPLETRSREMSQRVTQGNRENGRCRGGSTRDEGSVGGWNLFVGSGGSLLMPWLVLRFPLCHPTSNGIVPPLRDHIPGRFHPRARVQTMWCTLPRAATMVTHPRLCAI